MRPVLGPTEPRILVVPWPIFFVTDMPGHEADYCGGQECVELYLNFNIYFSQRVVWLTGRKTTIGPAVWGRCEWEEVEIQYPRVSTAECAASEVFSSSDVSEKRLRFSIPRYRLLSVPLLRYSVEVLWPGRMGMNRIAWGPVLRDLGNNRTDHQHLI
jgi:hypothetical protein